MVLLIVKEVTNPTTEVLGQRCGVRSHDDLLIREIT